LRVNLGGWADFEETLIQFRRTKAKLFVRIRTEGKDTTRVFGPKSMKSRRINNEVTAQLWDLQ